MDPYLEAPALWPDFHEQMVAALYQLLVPTLTDHYRIRAGTRNYNLEIVLFTSVTREPRTEPYLEIRPRGETKAVTIIDLVSPTNKTTPAGRAANLATRREALRCGASVVEVDLVLDGQPMLNLDRTALPDCDYAVIVTRAAQPDRHQVYTSTLAKSVPAFMLPLGGDHRDVKVDLQSAITRAYDHGQFDRRIDYSLDPSVPLSDTDRAWLRELLKRHKLRQ